VKSAEIAKENEKLKKELEEWHMFARIVRPKLQKLIEVCKGVKPELQSS
jgi:hypothetical protein